MNSVTALDEPSSFRVASYSPEWQHAMKEEIKALHMQGTWCLVIKILSAVIGFIKSRDSLMVL